jgi:predicted nucleic acid-binding protein
VSTLLLDASAILAAFDSEDDLHEAAKAILADPDVTLATLDLARYEVANVAVRAWRDPAQVSPLSETEVRGYAECASNSRPACPATSSES